MTRLSALGSAAVELAELGYQLVPVVAGGKMPIPQYRTPYGFTNRLRTPSGVEAAWSEYPDANVAVALKD